MATLGICLWLIAAVITYYIEEVAVLCCDRSQWTRPIQGRSGYQFGVRNGFEQPDRAFNLPGWLFHVAAQSNKGGRLVCAACRHDEPECLERLRRRRR